MIPGMNLLAVAMGAIASETVTWHQYTGRTKNALGQWVTTYAAPQQIDGSWQAVQRDQYAQLGLDMAKSYFNLFTPHGVAGVADGRAPDQIDHAGRRYSVHGVVPWSGIDGWNHAVCVDIGAVPND